MTIEHLAKAVISGGKEALIHLFKSSASTGKPFEDRIPYNPSIDKLECGLDLFRVRADMVITHADGSMTVIVAKDGAGGAEHVASGIGVASYCAAQLNMIHGSKTIVRTALLWSSTGNMLQEALLEDACIAANVVPLPQGALPQLLGITALSLSLYILCGGDPTDVDADAKEQVH